MRRMLALLLLGAAGCFDLRPEPDPHSTGPIEPDVFDVIRAGNSKAAVEALRDRYEQELQHARLLEAKIGELIAAEEGFAVERHDRLVKLQEVKDQVRALGDEQATLLRALDELSKSKADTAAKLDELKKENDALEKEIEAETARKAELEKRKRGG
jgi:hypothetical protein